MSKDVNDTDLFSFNDSFTSKLHKVKIGMVSAQKESEPEKTDTRHKVNDHSCISIAVQGLICLQPPQGPRNHIWAQCVFSEGVYQCLGHPRSLERCSFSVHPIGSKGIWDMPTCNGLSNESLPCKGSQIGSSSNRQILSRMCQAMSKSLALMDHVSAVEPSSGWFPIHNGTYSKLS